MFTGIIEATAKVLDWNCGCLTLERPRIFTDLQIGASIAISGVCLTIKKLNKKCMQFDVVPETLACSTLGSYEEGDFVNLERAMRADGRFDGHIVQGHCEGVGEVVSFSSPPSLPPPPVGEGGRGGEGITTHGFIPSVLGHARQMRSSPTKAEAVLWRALRNKQMLNLVARRQFPLGERILDFYFHGPRLGIEVDGSIHDDPDHQEFDCERMNNLIAAYGVRIIRFSNTRVLNDLQGVLQEIASVILSSPPSLPPPPVGEGGRGGEVIIRIPPTLLPFIVPKGSIAIDGVSLTVAAVEGEQITIALIPHTLASTTLGKLQCGDRVNIETDILARYARHSA